MSQQVRAVRVFFCFVLGLLAGIHQRTWAKDREEPVARPWSLFPVAFYTPETQIAGGGLLIYALDEGAPGQRSSVSVFTTYTQNEQILAAITPQWFFNEGNQVVTLVASYKDFPTKYYGTGNETEEANLESFTEEALSLGGRIKYRIQGPLFWRAGMGSNSSEITEYKDSPLIRAAVEEGFARHQDWFVSVGIHLDSRRIPASPRQGLFLGVDVKQAWIEAGNMRRDYWQWEFEALSFSPMGQDDVWANQVYVAQQYGDDIPFFGLLKLGSGNRIRGYYNGRFRDRALAFAQTEYRRNINSKWGGVVFAGTGSVFSGFDKLSLERWHASTGFGVRYMIDPHNRKKLRFDLAFTESGESGFYVLFGEAF